MSTFARKTIGTPHTCSAARGTKSFVLVSGLPGSGKSTLAGRLAPALDLPLLDKDDILERLFSSKGVGDARRRRALSRESDEVLQREAESSDGAVLVSFWRLPGMAEDSGTPTEWLRAHKVVHIQCICDPETAAQRFFQRKRHAGHLDAAASYDEVLARIQEVASLGPLDLHPRIDVNTSGPVNLEGVVREIATKTRSE
jgi:shikimate kinase